MFRKLATFLLGALVFLVCLEAGCRLAYKGYIYARDRENQKNPRIDLNEIRILAVGESTTSVAGDDSGRFLVMDTSYPAQLERLLNSKQSKIRYRVINAGIMAGNTSMIIDDLNRNLETYKPDIVLAMMGLKDAPNTKGFSAPMLKTVQLARWMFEAVSLKLRFCEGCFVQDDNEGDDFWWMVRGLRETRLAKIDHGETSVLPLLNQGLKVWNFGHHRAGVLLFEQVAARFQVGYYFLARMLASDGQLERALAVVKKARALHPDEGMYPIAEAELRMELGQFREAHAILGDVDKRLASFLEPKLIQNFKLLAEGELFRRQRDFKKALAAIGRVDENLVVPELTNFFPPLDMLKEGALGEIYIDMGDWTSAKEHLNKVVTKYPLKSVYQWRLATVYRKLNDLNGEKEMRREIFKRRGHDFYLADYYEYYKLLKLMGRTEQIPALFEEATSSLPSLKQNFAALYEKTRQSGAKLILMQYPGFSVDIMAMYAPQAKDVTVVDNEHLFDSDPERYFFEARLPYAYSHFTKDGARLIALQAQAAIESQLNGRER